MASNATTTTTTASTWNKSHPILSFLHIVVGEISKRNYGVNKLPFTSPKQHENELRTACGRSIAFLLTTLTRALHGSDVESYPRTVFDDPDGLEPRISLGDYFERIIQFTRAPKEVFLIALINMDKFLVHSSFQFPIRATSVHRMFFTSFVVASKIHDDGWYSNRYYARVAGVETEELNITERAFIFGCGFNLSVQRKLFDCYDSLIDEIAVNFYNDRFPLHLITPLSHSITVSTVNNNTTSTSNESLTVVIVAKCNQTPPAAVFVSQS